MDKPKADRLREGVHLLKQLQGGGVAETAPGYMDVKNRITEWVESGERWEGRISFPSYGRYADVVLPKKASQTATIAFKVSHHRR
jgi:acyl-CoA-binding protein